MFQFYLSSIKSNNGYLIAAKDISFNSTLVQLKAILKIVRPQSSHVFQFYLSSIKRDLCRSFPYFSMGFQFYLSSIKSKTCNVFTLLLGEFQFYLSSIKSGSGQGGSSFSSEFQFYLSSIKRRLELVVIRLLRSFNSTLVQLKVIEGINKNNTSAGFNSTLVQLKDADHFRFSQWEKKCQFYLS